MPPLFCSIGILSSTCASCISLGFLPIVSIGQSYDQRGLILLKRRTGNYVVPAQLSLRCLTFYLSESICINSLFCRLVLDVKRSLKIGRDRIQRLHQKAHYGLIKIGSWVIIELFLRNHVDLVHISFHSKPQSWHVTRKAYWLDISS